MWSRRKMLMLNAPLWLTLAMMFGKLTGILDWPWTWVLAPMWVIFAVALVIWVPSVIYNTWKFWRMH